MAAITDRGLVMAAITYHPVTQKLDLVKTGSPVQFLQPKLVRGYIYIYQF